SIFQQADAFSRKGIRYWAGWFKGRPLEIDMGAIAWDWPRTQEIFERRNIVIHNGSRVTRQYLNNVDRGLLEGLREGSPIEITPEYIEETLERLSTIGLLLAYKVRWKLFRRDSPAQISQWITQKQFD